MSPPLLAAGCDDHMRGTAEGEGWWAAPHGDRGARRCALDDPAGLAAFLLQTLGITAAGANRSDHRNGLYRDTESR